MPQLQSSDRGNYATSLAQSAIQFCQPPEFEGEQQGKPSTSGKSAIGPAASGPIDSRPALQTKFSDECSQWRSCFEEQGAVGESKVSGICDDH